LAKHRLFCLWGVIAFLFLLLAGGCQNGAPAASTPELTQPPAAVMDTPSIGLQDSTPPVASAGPASTQTPGAPTTQAPPTDTLQPGKPSPIPSITLSPTVSKTPTKTLFSLPTWTRIPSSTPKISPTPTPPPAALRILRPGPFSKITSPLNVEAGAVPGDDGLVLVDLIGEDGRTITRQRLDFSEYIGRSIGIAPKLEFSIPGVAETVRLVLSSEDKFGRKIAVTSEELVLLSIGDNQFYQAGYQAAPYILKSPVQDEIIKGGTLKVSGLARPVNLSPLIFEIIDEKSQVLASAQLKVALPGGDQSHTPFSIDIPYKIPIQTRVRLSVRQASDDRIPGTVALWSVAILLLP
jgi:hypothetical protein